MRYIVCGSRSATDQKSVFDALDALDAELRISAIIEGGQRTIDAKTRRIIGGVDYFAYLWAIERGRDAFREDANWRDYGRSAGPIRNRAMLKYNPAGVIAFPGGSGTADMVKQARVAGVAVIVA